MRTAALFLFLTGVSIFAMSGVSTAADKGEFPFFPSLLNTKSGGAVSSGEFEHPERCKVCHLDIYNQWKGSTHSAAFVDPVFQAMWKLGERETGGTVRNFCAGCHSPIGTVGKEITFDKARGAFSASQIAEKGVECDFCHTVVKSTWRDTPTSEPQNGSLVVEPGNVKTGPYGDSDSPGHDTAFSQLQVSAEFCGSCHNVYHPVTNYPIARTYDEWKHSVYANANIVCQDCHMMPVEKAIEAARTLVKPVNPGKASPLGPNRKTLYTHGFAGGNFTVPGLLGSETHSMMAKEMLKNAAELAVHLPEKAVKGHLVKFKVDVINTGAGHNLPTGFTQIRQMWLDVTVTDPRGNVLMRSGALDDNGALDPEANIFGTLAVDKNGDVTYKPWAISYFSRVRVIPPKGSDESTYVFLVPDKAGKGNLNIDVVLRYRSFSQKLADDLLGKERLRVPVVDMKRVKEKMEIVKR